MCSARCGRRCLPADAGVFRADETARVSRRMRTWTARRSPESRALNVELVKALKAPEVSDELVKAGLLPAPGTRAELARYIERESRTWAKVVVERKITAE